MIILQWFFILLFVLVMLYQLFYLAAILFLIPQNKKLRENHTQKTGNISIVIPVYNSEKTIGKCLASILKNNLSFLEKIIVILDHCTDRSAEITSRYQTKFDQQNINLELIYLDGKERGKVAGLQAGFGNIRTRNALLLDADIILSNKAIESLLSSHFQKNSFCTTCLIYPHQSSRKSSLINQIINNDRLYRQNILQKTRAAFGAANHPGGLAVVDVKKYQRFLEAGFLEDLTATYSIFSSTETITLLNAPLAFEIERQSLRGVFWQRIRWTIGNLENLPLLIKSIFRCPSFLKKTLIVSYPVMWYLQHYVITAGVLFFSLSESYFWLLIPYFGYTAQILLSAYTSKTTYRNSVPGVLAHSIVFPITVTAAFFGALFVLLKNRKFYFNTNLLFARV